MPEFPIAMTTMAISNSTRVKPLSLDASRRNVSLASADAEGRRGDLDAHRAGPPERRVRGQPRIDPADAVVPRARRELCQQRGRRRRLQVAGRVPGVACPAPLEVVLRRSARGTPGDERCAIEAG